MPGLGGMGVGSRDTVMFSAWPSDLDRGEKAYPAGSFPVRLMVVSALEALLDSGRRRTPKGLGARASEDREIARRMEASGGFTSREAH